MKPTKVFPVTPTINDACVRSKDNDIEEDKEIRNNVYCDVTSPTIVQHTDDIPVAPSVEYAPSLVNEPPDPYVPDERSDAPTLNIGEIIPPDSMNIAVDQLSTVVVVPGLDESHQVKAPPTSSRPYSHCVTGGLLWVRLVTVGYYSTVLNEEWRRKDVASYIDI